MLRCWLSVTMESMREKRLHSQQPADLVSLVKEMVNSMRGEGWEVREGRSNSMRKSNLSNCFVNWTCIMTVNTKAIWRIKHWLVIQDVETIGWFCYTRKRKGQFNKKKITKIICLV